MGDDFTRSEGRLKAALLLPPLPEKILQQSAAFGGQNAAFYGAVRIEARLGKEINHAAGCAAFGLGRTYNLSAKDSQQYDCSCPPSWHRQHQLARIDFAIR